VRGRRCRAPPGSRAGSSHRGAGTAHALPTRCNIATEVACGFDVTLAWHAALRYMPSAGNAPFWALSSLGGDRSVIDEREPLRGYGADRFIDRNMFATGLELRTSVVNLNAFGTHVSVEAAPFLDAGKVFAALGGSPFSRLHATPGFGVRGVANPFIVGYVDFGLARGRVAVFSGIDYPFRAARPPGGCAAHLPTATGGP